MSEMCESAMRRQARKVGRGISMLLGEHQLVKREGGQGKGRRHAGQGTGRTTDQKKEKADLCNCSARSGFRKFRICMGL